MERAVVPRHTRNQNATLDDYYYELLELQASLEQRKPPVPFPAAMIQIIRWFMASPAPEHCDKDIYIASLSDFREPLSRQNPPVKFHVAMTHVLRWFDGLPESEKVRILRD